MPLPVLTNIVGQGLGSDMTTTHTIGIIDPVEGLISATIYWPDGSTTQLNDLQLNSLNIVKPWSHSQAAEIYEYISSYISMRHECIVGQSQNITESRSTSLNPRQHKDIVC